MSTLSTKFIEGFLSRKNFYNLLVRRQSTSLSLSSSPCRSSGKCSQKAILEDNQRFMVKSLLCSSWQNACACLSCQPSCVRALPQSSSAIDSAVPLWQCSKNFRLSSGIALGSDCCRWLAGARTWTQTWLSLSWEGNCLANGRCCWQGRISGNLDGGQGVLCLSLNGKEHWRQSQGQQHYLWALAKKIDCCLILLAQDQ